ncbi:hypothetical protein BaRGS_00009403 [Batillaria attramentaria]|uniref:Uncharacterized protein n=1 Tax=Batillaria attramentaria TaxID=370345 RepID=A0ABD0LJY7_9CAEN
MGQILLSVQLLINFPNGTNFTPCPINHQTFSPYRTKFTQHSISHMNAKNLTQHPHQLSSLLRYTSVTVQPLQCSSRCLASAYVCMCTAHGTNFKHNSHWCTAITSTNWSKAALHNCIQQSLSYSSHSAVLATHPHGFADNLFTGAPQTHVTEHGKHYTSLQVQPGPGCDTITSVQEETNSWQSSLSTPRLCGRLAVSEIQGDELWRSL